MAGLIDTEAELSRLNKQLEKAAKDLIKDGNYNEEILNLVEMTIRAHDPCLSCATHTLDGKIGIKFYIVDAEGNHLDTFSNV